MFVRPYVSRCVLLAAIALGTTAIAAAAVPTFVVTSLADSGPGSLREQLEAAKVAAQSGYAEVRFAVSGVINLASPLTLTTRPIGPGMLIDGDGQITLNGGNSVQIMFVTLNSNVTLRGLTIANGKAATGGALLSNGGIVTIQHSTFLNNSATDGGALANRSEGWLTIENCTFEGNQADNTTGRGGAVWNFSISDTWITNSTFYNNRAAQGGAVANEAYLEMYSSTFSGNSATSGGAVFNGKHSILSPTILFKNVITANSAAGGNCAALALGLTDGGGNFSYPDSTCPGAMMDPKLGPLSDNGGYTKTMALLAGSPAIDSGANCVKPGGAPLPIDQRGVSRPQGISCDSGAFEKSVASKIGAYTAGYWALDQNGNSVWDGTGLDRLTYWTLGVAGETPVYGDWNGDGRTKTGVFADGTWLLDYNGNGVWDGPGVDKLVYFGGPGYQPVLGNWNGSGGTKIGVYQNGTWMIDYNGDFTWGGLDRVVFFGGAGYTPVVEDWNRTGTTKIGAYQNGTWLIDYNGNFAWDGAASDKLVFFGGTGYTPVVGDWNGSGSSKIGVHQNGLWLLDYNGNYGWDGAATDKLVFFGGAGYTPVVGDWNGSGTTKIAAYLNGLWVIDQNGNFAWDPANDRVAYFGGPGQAAIAGKW